MAVVAMRREVWLPQARHTVATTRLERAPLAYLLSAFAAIVYIVGRGLGRHR
jgi:hypothetical protein